jgi:predicted nucleic acid-binding protein
MEKIEKQFEFTTITVLSPLVLTLGEETTYSAHDCEYASLALTLGCPLITNDKRLLHSFPSLTMNVNSFLVNI